MTLPIVPPLKPMLAKATSGIPDGDYIYEPKWDGFRCIIFRDGSNVELGSRNERPLTRYFPEVVEEVLRQLPERCVIDGEIVLVGDGGELEFDQLQQRIHPAESRIKRLSQETPASFVAFDLLAHNDDLLTNEPFSIRRERLTALLNDVTPPIYLTPATYDNSLARVWFDQFEGAGLDGIVAKSPSLKYQPDKRVMLKIKHERTADCVVAGFRWHKVGDVVGSLLLGLYDDDGILHHVGVTASFTMARRKELLDEIAAVRMDDLAGHPWESWAVEATEVTGTRKPGAVSRWNAKKDLSWIPLRPELVCEVGYDHLQGNRFRHATTFKRWRPDRDIASCTYGQLEVSTEFTLEQIFNK